MPDPPQRKPQPAPPAPPANPRLSMRDLAARTIQAHFCLFLVRRSQALHHLKHLAAVRSHVVAIKSSLSDQARLNPEALSQQASDLLLQLDSIQNTDLTIQEGKRSISRELVQLLELAEGLSAKRHELFTEPIEIVHKGIDPLLQSLRSSAHPYPCSRRRGDGTGDNSGFCSLCALRQHIDLGQTRRESLHPLPANLCSSPVSACQLFGRSSERESP